MIELRDVVKTYSGNINAVDGLNLTVNDHEVCVLIGPSGCGKSTILNMINRLIPITSGEIIINGNNIMDWSPIELRRNIGYSIQEVALFPHKTVAENITTVPRLNKWTKEKMAARVDELLDLIGLDPSRYRDKYPSQLSGGERQRVGVARALGADPPILLMDEPFGAIDPITRTRLQDEFLLVQEKIKKTIIFVTHDINEAIKMGDKIALLDKGKLVQYDAPKDLLENPANEFVERFMGTDRNMKWLQLLYAEDLLEYRDVYCLDTDEYEDIVNKYKDTPLSSIPVLDKDKKLIGYLRLKDALKKGTKDWTNSIKKYDDSIETKTTVYEALIEIVISENNYLPVLGLKNQYLGVLTMAQVNKTLNEIKGEEDGVS